MPNGTLPPLSDDELQALVDDRLDPVAREAAMARARSDPATNRTVMDFRSQRAALRGLHAAVLTEPLPPSLDSAARRLAQARRSQGRWWQWGGMAATVALAFGSGWWTHGQVATGAALATGPAASPGRSPSLAGQQFVRLASVAHGVYAPEVRHPVEVTSAQQEHLVQWLSKRLGRPLKLPQLSAAGFELVGGRLLPGDVGARAQFMFQNAAGDRVTLYLGAIAAPAPNGQETAFRFASEGSINSFYWMDQGFGYALSGQIGREQLMPLAQLVYQQL